MQAAGLNPYRHAPGAPELQPLHSDTLPRLVNHPAIKTPYFPLAQWVFRLAHGLSGEAVWGMKAFVLLAEAWPLRAYASCSVTSGSRPATSLLYAAAPWRSSSSPSTRTSTRSGFPFLVFGPAPALRGWKITGLLLLGLSMSVKPVAG